MHRCCNDCWNGTSKTFDIVSCNAMTLLNLIVHQGCLWNIIFFILIIEKFCFDTSMPVYFFIFVTKFNFLLYLMSKRLSSAVLCCCSCVLEHRRISQQGRQLSSWCEAINDAWDIEFGQISSKKMRLYRLNQYKCTVWINIYKRDYLESSIHSWIGKLERCID